MTEKPQRSHITTTIRSVDAVTMTEFRRLAGAHGLTQAEYLRRLVNLHLLVIRNRQYHRLLDAVRMPVPHI